MTFKKTLPALMALCAGSAFAGTMGPTCDMAHLTTPCADTAWDVGGRALYLQPSFSNDPWTYERDATDANGNNSQVLGTPQDYGWGFFLEGSYHFEQGKDFNLNWYYFDNTTRDNHALAANGSMSASVATSWNAVNFEFGQAIIIGDSNEMRLHGGVEYARVKSTKDLNLNQTVASPVLGLNAIGTIVGSQTASFNGFGPRVGVDLGYNLPNTWMDGFKIYANGAVALLAGASKIHENFTGTSGLTGTAHSTSNQVVPELDLKLGLNYTQGGFTADAGWLWYDYLAVIQQNDNDQGNVSFQGLYFGLKWLGNLA